jgi:hypothetical protein
MRVCGFFAAAPSCCGGSAVGWFVVLDAPLPERLFSRCLALLALVTQNFPKCTPGGYTPTSIRQHRSATSPKNIEPRCLRCRLTGGCFGGMLKMQNSSVDEYAGVAQLRKGSKGKGRMMRRVSASQSSIVRYFERLNAGAGPTIGRGIMNCAWSRFFLIYTCWLGIYSLQLLLHLAEESL